MQEPDPLAEFDVYATEKKEQTLPQMVNSEESDLDFEIGDVLKKSFTQERSRSSLVSNIPSILKKKDDASYAKMYKGITMQDVNNVSMG